MGGLVSRIFRILWVGGWVGVGELVYTFYTLLGDHDSGLPLASESQLFANGID